MERNNIKDDKDLPAYFITSQDLNYNERINMQSVWQKHIDASISSTINVPNNFTVEDVEDVYKKAWALGLKGVTIFRDGCAREGILSTGGAPVQENNTELQRGEWAPKPADTIYYERKIKIGCGRVVLFIGWSEKENRVVDFFVKKSGNGGCEKLLETAAITFSAIFRLGGNVDNIKKALRGVGSCPSFATARTKGNQLSKGNNCGCAIINEIEAFLKEKDIPTETDFKLNTSTKISSNNKCPECGEEIIFTGGCMTCPSCGYSKCN
jgi:ribonucleoside-diphosphate reductase alpha chain